MKLTFSDGFSFNYSANHTDRKPDTRLIEMTGREMKLIAAMRIQSANPDLQELLNSLQGLCRKPELLPGLINMINDEMVRQLREETLSNPQHNNKHITDID